MHVNKLENQITFNINKGCYQTKSKITADKNGENVFT